MSDLHVPGAKDDSAKLRHELIPPEALEALARVLTYGARKYVDHGWLKVPNAKERYTGALMRHLNAWRAGEMCDPESELPHLEHVLTNAAFLVVLRAEAEDRADVEAYDRWEAEQGERAKRG